MNENSKESVKEKLRVPGVAAVVDLVVVLVFVAIGRRNHDEEATLSGYVGTVAPFFMALAATWFVSRAWRAPVAARTGYTVWIGTVVMGMLLRKFVFADGTATAFVIVATVFLGAGINLWRLAVRPRNV